MPKFSIIIPLYNSEKFIGATLASVLAQTYCDFEVIIVNDGSTDTSLDIVQAIAKKNTRIVVITQPNRGVASARNRGLDSAAGDFICFVDSDDLLHPDALKFCLGRFEEDPSLDAVCYREKTVQCQEAPEWEPIVLDKVSGYDCSEREIFKRLYVDSFMRSFLDFVFRKSIILPFRFPAFVRGEDLVWRDHVLLGARLRHVEMTDSVLYYYVQNPESCTHRKPNLALVLGQLAAIRDWIDAREVRISLVYTYRDERILSFLNDNFLNDLPALAMPEIITALRAWSETYKAFLRRHQAGFLQRVRFRAFCCWKTRANFILFYIWPVRCWTMLRRFLNSLG